ncbi:MAG: DsrE family protein [Desulfatiglandaceae bacterium]
MALMFRLKVVLLGFLVLKNEEIQKKINEAQEKGIHFIACKACADQLGITEGLEKLGIEVDYTGELLTNILKSRKSMIPI